MTYYYLAASLVPIEFGDISEISFLDLVDQYQRNFTSYDKKQLEILRLYFDLENIRLLYTFRSSSVSLDPRGRFSQEELTQALKDERGFPQYVYDFLHKYGTDHEVVFYFSKLLSDYLTYEAQQASGFVREYLKFEKNLRIILTGFRAKKLKKDVRQELMFEDPHDPVVAAVLSQQESHYFEAPAGYEELQEMLLTTDQQPMYQYRHLAEFRFRKLREMVAHKPFSLDYLLSYLLRVAILEDLRQLDETKGSEILQGILKDSA